MSLVDNMNEFHEANINNLRDSQGFNGRTDYAASSKSSMPPIYIYIIVS